MQVIYHGHSFIEIETVKGSILIDPFVTNNPKCDISLADVFSRSVTHIILTHGHDDHIGDTLAIMEQMSEVRVICMVELGDWIEGKGIHPDRIVRGNIGGMCQIDDWTMRFVRADHSSSTPDGGYAGLAAGVVVRISNKAIYHAGDTAYFADMEQFAREKIDVAFLPIGDRYTMGVDDAVRAAGLIQAKILVPIHYNTRPIIKADDMHFAQQIMLKQYGVPKVLRAGQYVVL